jgi:hypothetical protein
MKTSSKAALYVVSKKDFHSLIISLLALAKQISSDTFAASFTLLIVCQRLILVLVLVLVDKVASINRSLGVLQRCYADSPRFTRRPMRRLLLVC